MSTSSGAQLRRAVSADKRFITVIPQGYWSKADGSAQGLTVEGRYKERPRRFGLKMFGGRVGGSFSQAFRFEVEPRAVESFPFTLGGEPGQATSVLEIGRLSPALPTILPSYNQLGFDSIHYHLGFVGGDERRALLWAVGAKLVGGGADRSMVDPELNIRFPIRLDYDRGAVTLVSEKGFTLEFNGWDMPLDLYRFSTLYRGDGRLDPAYMNAEVRCDDIKFYGPFLKVLGVSDFRSGLMHVSGAAGKVRDLGVHAPPELRRFGEIEVAREKSAVRARFRGSRAGAKEHNYGLLLMESGREEPLPLNYTKVTTVGADADGAIAQVTVPLPRAYRKTAVTALVMVDTHQVAKRELGS